jgi:hypothetical protein
MEVSNEGPTPTDSRIEDLTRQLLTVQQQVGQLELAAQEKKKPWWLQTSLVISILSLTLSASFSLYTASDQVRQRALDDARHRAAALDTTLAEIVAIRMEDTKQAVALASSNLGAYRAWSATATVKRAMLIDSAMNEIGKLKVDLAPTSALTMGNELIMDGRYQDAERLLKSGIKAAEKAKTSSTMLLSTLAQVYLFPGSPLYNPAQGRALYWRAIDSYPSQADYYVLSNKLNLMLYWAANEQGFKNPAASADLLKTAGDIVRESVLPEGAKIPLQALVDSVRTQLSLQNLGPTLLAPSKLVGKWRIVEPDSQSSDIIFIPGPGTAFPSFTKDRIFSGRLVERISGFAVILGQSSMRLDWGTAFDTGINGPFPKTGYSDVTLGPDGALHGTDLALGLPPRKWTARMPPTIGVH